MSKAKGIYLISNWSVATIYRALAAGVPEAKNELWGSQRSESISSSSFVNIFHESEYIDRRKNKSKHARRKILFVCSFSVSDVFANAKVMLCCA